MTTGPFPNQPPHWQTGQGPNADGSYTQDYFFDGTGAVSRINVQYFHSPTLALQAAQRCGKEALAAYTDGDVVFFVKQQATPVEASAAKAVPSGSFLATS